MRASYVPILEDLIPHPGLRCHHLAASFQTLASLSSSSLGLIISAGLSSAPQMPHQTHLPTTPASQAHCAPPAPLSQKAPFHPVDPARYRAGRGGGGHATLLPFHRHSFQVTACQGFDFQNMSQCTLHGGPALPLTSRRQGGRGGRSSKYQQQPEGLGGEAFRH